MKKLFTLLILGLIVMSADAQSGHQKNKKKKKDLYQDNRSFDYDDDNHNNRYGDKDFRRNGNNGRYENRSVYSQRNLQKEIARINREYDFKIQQIRHDRYLSRFQKKRQIRFLEQQRQQEIRRVYTKNRYRNDVLSRVQIHF